MTATRARTSSSSSRRTISRAQAAGILVAARRAFRNAADIAGDSIGWALTVMRENIHARKLKIDFLLRAGHFDAADALIARSIMQGNDHPLMRLRFAESLYAQGRYAQADAEVQRVLRERPNHVRALSLAARIASALRQPRRAVSQLIAACDERPHDQRLAHQLVEAMLQANLVHRAAEQLSRMQPQPAALKARVLRAQLRTLEAIETLEREAALSCSRDRDDHGDLAAVYQELIDLLREIGEATRLRRLCDDETSMPPAVRLSLAEALLAMGDFEHAAATLRELWADPAHRDRVWPAMLVASSLQDDEKVASHAHELFADAPRSLSISRIARLWLAGLQGRVVARQATAREAGADPAASALRPMLRDAVATFDDQLGGDFTESQRAALQLHRALCINVLRPQSEQPIAEAREHTAVTDNQVQAPVRRAA